MDRGGREHVRCKKGVFAAEELERFMVDCFAEEEDISVQMVLRWLVAMWSSQPCWSDDQKPVDLIAELLRETEKERI